MSSDLRKSSAIFLLSLLAACNTVSMNEMENKIEGKWKQIGGLGAISDMNLLFEYTFTNKKEFTQEAFTSKDQNVIYKQGFKQEGTFQIKGDSLHLYKDSNSESSFYNAKIQFIGNTKFILLDENGELDYEREN